MSCELQLWVAVVSCELRVARILDDSHPSQTQKVKADELSLICISP